MILLLLLLFQNFNKVNTTSFFVLYLIIIIIDFIDIIHAHDHKVVVTKNSSINNNNNINESTSNDHIGNIRSTSSHHASAVGAVIQTKTNKKKSDNNNNNNNITTVKQDEYFDVVPVVEQVVMHNNETATIVTTKTTTTNTTRTIKQNHNDENNNRNSSLQSVWISGDKEVDNDVDNGNANNNNNNNNNNTVYSSQYTTYVQNATVQIPLHAESGSHHIEIFVGQPPILQTLIVDTGSRLTSWICYNDDDYDDNNNNNPNRKYRYDPMNSTTVQHISCPNECVFVGDSKCERILLDNNEYDDNDEYDDQDDSSYKNNKNKIIMGENKCVVKQRYTEGSSWTAYEVNDIIAMNLIPTTTKTKTKKDTIRDTTNTLLSYYYEESVYTTIPYTFGCQISASGQFRKQYANGILGLERYNEQTLPKQLYKHGITQSTSFSICLSMTAGYIGFGGALYDKHISNMQYTPLLTNTYSNNKNTKNITSGMYTVYVEEVWLGDVCITSNTIRSKLLNYFNTGKGTILDSGTTDTFLPLSIKDTFNSIWKQVTGRSITSQAKLPYTLSEYLLLPDLKFIFRNNVTLIVPPINYMEGATELITSANKHHTLLRRQTTYNSNNNNNMSIASVTNSYNNNNIIISRNLQMGIYTDEPIGAVLGINSLIGYDVLFDTVNNIIGFAQANCDD